MILITLTFNKQLLSGINPFVNVFQDMVKEAEQFKFSLLINIFGITKVV